MTPQETITLKGKSNTLYTFNVYPINYDCPDHGGIYVYTNRVPPTGIQATHYLIYIGKTNSFKTRHEQHDDHECIQKHKPTCICLKWEASEQRRLAIEKDILLGNTTSCNVQHNT